MTVDTKNRSMYFPLCYDAYLCFRFGRRPKLMPVSGHQGNFGISLPALRVAFNSSVPTTKHRSFFKFYLAPVSCFDKWSRADDFRTASPHWVYIHDFESIIDRIIITRVVRRLWICTLVRTASIFSARVLCVTHLFYFRQEHGYKGFFGCARAGKPASFLEKSAVSNAKFSLLRSVDRSVSQLSAWRRNFNVGCALLAERYSDLVWNVLLTH